VILVDVGNNFHLYLYHSWVLHLSYYFNLLNPELNPICYLLALLTYHFLHVSRIRVNMFSNPSCPILYTSQYFFASRNSAV